MSVFPNASNIVINGGQFNALVGTSGSKGLDLLLEHTALGGLLHSNERFDPPRCDEDTRIAVVQHILDWLNSQDHTASMMVLHGPAGSGKSALAQSLAEKCLQNCSLLASFFFSRTALNRNDGNALIPTLVYQMAQISPYLRQQVSNAIDRDPGILKMSRQKQMEALITEPLRPPRRRWWRRFLAHFVSGSSSQNGIFPSVIVVDGLDESNDPEVQCDLLRVMASAIPLLPSHTRILITSRPESHILHTLNHDSAVQAICVRRVDIGRDPNANADIRTFLLKEFGQIRRTHPLKGYLADNWPSGEAISRLVEKVSTQFIYAATVMKYVRSRKHRPDDRLKVIIRLPHSSATTADKPLAQLDALYAHIFSCVDKIDLVLRIFGILYLSANRAEEFELGVEHMIPAKLEEIFGLKAGDVELALDDLVSIVELLDRERPIRILHASLFDFLLDHSRSGPFAVDLRLAHETLALSHAKIISAASSDQIEISSRLRSVRLLLQHCQYAKLSPEIHTRLCSLEFLPFHPDFITNDVKTCPPDVSVEEEWRIMDSFECVLVNKELDDSRLFANLVNLARHQIRSLIISSPSSDFFKPFQPRFSEILSEPETHRISKQVAVDVLTLAKFALLLKWIEPDASNPTATYPRAIIVSSQFWLRNTLGKPGSGDLSNASLLFAQILFPYSEHYGPLVDLLANSAKLEGISDPRFSSNLIDQVVAYLERIKSQIQPSVWKRLKKKCGFLSR